jgi:hypothetical protein
MITVGDAGSWRGIDDNDRNGIVAASILTALLEPRPIIS